MNMLQRSPIFIFSSYKTLSRESVHLREIQPKNHISLTGGGGEVLCSSLGFSHDVLQVSHQTSQLPQPCFSVYERNELGNQKQAQIFCPAPGQMLIIDPDTSQLNTFNLAL